MIGLGLSITQRAVLQMLRAEYSPALLFSAGEQGVWYDPSDMSTMFQDAAGMTPVTGMEQPVGLILDKSGRGNHATQTTTAERPVLQARYNLLTNTETLSTQTVTTMATTQRLRFEGTGTITLSGTATGTYSAGSHTFTTTAGSLTLTVSGTVTRADLRAANDGIGLPEYQRVGAATSGTGSTAGNADYDTAGFPPYLRFFGAGTRLSTGSIDFAGINKITVFAGFRKLATLTQSLAVTKLIDSADKGFGVWAESGTSDVVRAFGGSSVNGNITSVYATGLPPPLTLAATFTGDISADLNIIRINGLVSGQNTADQGIGDYGSSPLFIGSDPTPGSRFFTGRIYSLIVRGAQSTAQQISDTETWVNGKTRAYA